MVITTSFDSGRTWTPKKQFYTGPTSAPEDPYYYPVPRITHLRDGRLCVALTRAPSTLREEDDCKARIILCFSSDNGETWDSHETTVPGIVPDKMVELESGRWLLATHWKNGEYLTQFLHWSDDQGKTWHGPVTVAEEKGLNLCEASLLPLGNGEVAAFLRENSSMGYDCKKALSHDGGMTWGELCDFPLSGCHRPVAGFLRDGRIFITYRYAHYGKGWKGNWTQNFFGAFTDVASAKAVSRKEAWARIIPLDYDRSPKSDLGYSGWVQLDDGEIYIVSYIVDDGYDKGQIRGYAIRPEDWLLPER